jgi:hypothetical protein
MSTLRSGEERILPMQVQNIGFLLDRLGQDCAPLQFLRELTQNSIEAILRTGEPGQILWDVDNIQLQLLGRYKLSITDTGDGMTGPQMKELINSLSSSMSEQSMSGNYGVGAKITAATKNPAGVQYYSWNGNEGALIEMIKESGQYGLKQLQKANGDFVHWLPINEDAKPKLIKSHGTKVVLLGATLEENTMIAPRGVSYAYTWIAKYLNTRYFEFPAGITVRAREGWDKKDSDTGNITREVLGQKSFLSANSISNGTFDMPNSNCKAHWWILKEEKNSDTSRFDGLGHTAALYKSEIYESSRHSSRLQQFGITFGHKRVVIYIQPKSDSLTTNTARTMLLANNEPLPWADWATEFRANLPQEIINHIQQNAPSSNSDNEKAIKERLKEFFKLFRVSRFRLQKNGKNSVDPESFVRESNERERNDSHTGSGTRPEITSTAPGSNIYSLFEKENGNPAEAVANNPYPNVRWVKGQDEEIVDRAAKYVPETNYLLINVDFPAFTDMVDYFNKLAGDSPGYSEKIYETAKIWYEQALTETVIGIQGLKNRRLWSEDDIAKAFSPEALTVAVMQRYNIYHQLKRSVRAMAGTKVSSVEE